MKLNRRTKVAVILFLPVVIFTIARIFFPPGPDIVCHKGLDGALLQWMLENQTNAYPNVGGNGRDGLLAFVQYFDVHNRNALHDYAYVSGLCSDDSSNLVLFYVKEKSRSRWHGERFPTVFHEKKWVVISPGFQDDGIELNAWIDTAEFRKRLSETIEFLKKENRPNWQTTVAEQEKFLESIKNQER